MTCLEFVKSAAVCQVHGDGHLKADELQAAVALAPALRRVDLDVPFAHGDGDACIALLASMTWLQALAMQCREVCTAMTLPRPLLAVA